MATQISFRRVTVENHEPADQNIADEPVSSCSEVEYGVSDNPSKVNPSMPNEKRVEQKICNVKSASRAVNRTNPRSLDAEMTVHTAANDPSLALNTNEAGIFLTIAIFLAQIGLVCHILNVNPAGQPAFHYLNIPYNNDYYDSNGQRVNTQRTDIVSASYLTVATICTGAIAALLFPFLHWNAVTTAASQCTIVIFDVLIASTLILVVTYMIIMTVNPAVFYIVTTDFSYILGWVAVVCYTFSLIAGIIWTCYVV